MMMTNCKISPRLQEVAKLVELKPYVDIGADHGYLDLYLSKAGWGGPIVATENKSGPYQRLCNNIKESGIPNNIQCVFADGLNFDYRDYDQIVIAGMGGGLISNILLNSKYGVDNFNTLILEPQSDTYILRKTIDELGFKIVYEKYLNERAKTYSVIKCEKGHQPFDEVTLMFGEIPLKKRDKVLYNFLKRNKNRIEDYLENDLISSEAKRNLNAQLDLTKKGLKYYE